MAVPAFLGYCLGGAHRDYSGAGFKLCPAKEGPTKYTALQTVVYAVLMMPVGMLPYFIGLSGLVSVIVVTAANVFLIIQCLRLYKATGCKSRTPRNVQLVYLPAHCAAGVAGR
jgi:protoheme IX farnesyltransferase